MAGRPRQNEYFVPRDGIDREVITSDICRFLGKDALVRPGYYENAETRETIQGYYINAYRNLTTAMIDDLKATSREWADERKRVSGGANSTNVYQASQTHQRQRADNSHQHGNPGPQPGYERYQQQPTQPYPPGGPGYPQQYPPSDQGNYPYPQHQHQVSPPPRPDAQYPPPPAPGYPDAPPQPAFSDETPYQPGGDRRVLYPEQRGYAADPSRGPPVPAQLPQSSGYPQPPPPQQPYYSQGPPPAGGHNHSYMSRPVQPQDPFYGRGGYQKQQPGAYNSEAIPQPTSAAPTAKPTSSESNSVAGKGQPPHGPQEPGTYEETRTVTPTGDGIQGATPPPRNHREPPQHRHGQY